MKQLWFAYHIDVTRILSTLINIVQQYTQSGGTRPFGIAALIAGFDDNDVPRLFQAEPSGTYQEWMVRPLQRVAQDGNDIDI